MLSTLSHGQGVSDDRLFYLAFSVKRTTVIEHFRVTENCPHLPSVFIDILSSMRLGVLSRAHIQILTKLSRPLIYADGIEPSRLWVLHYCDLTAMARLISGSDSR
ncbi:hypothetical protein C8R43DRAFT_245110 [Mycena crocata]|nr:hypothetical protein C8R43DRAFT_245110 [Mycena crocata]